MATPETIQAPTLGDPGQPCASCGAPLAADQRYCLECGTRRAEARIPFLDVLAPARPATPETPDRPSRLPRSDSISPGLAAAGVGLAVLFLGVGVLVGKAGSSDQGRAAAKPTVVTVAGGAAVPSGAAATPASTSQFKGDWPSGRDGWTVQLQTLAKGGTNPAKVQAAKAAAGAKGAQEVGALDSDNFGSLDGGNYVVYSGRFDSEAKAKAALAKLHKPFPGAKVIHVSGAAPAAASAKAKADKQQVDQLQGLSGSNYAKKSQKLPSTLALPGKPPPKDNKQGGGGSGFQTIK